jgi:tetratricopeptide (TPR) repeat protein
MNLAAQILLKNALDCIAKDRLDEAEELLKKALVSAPDHQDVLRIMSVVAALKFEYVRALDLINRAIAIAPLDGVAHSNKGNILKELGRYEEALSSYEESIRLLPAYAEAYSNRGNVLQDLQRFEEAIPWYDKAIAIDPHYVKAYCNKGSALMTPLRSNQAIQMPIGKKASVSLQAVILN